MDTVLQRIDLFKIGFTVEEIATYQNVSHQAVSLSLRRRGLGKQDGGQTIRAIVFKVDAAAKRTVARDKRIRKIFGCSYQYYKWFKKKYGGYANNETPIWKYLRQKQNSKERQIPWDLTLISWWNLWEKSGKWGQRGRHHGEYVMARLDDEGPYSIENIEIVLNTENIIEYYMREFGGIYTDTLIKARIAAKRKAPANQGLTE